MKRYITTCFIGLFLFAMATDSMAQRRSRTSTRDKQEKTDKLSIKDKMAYDIFIGTLGFNRGFSFSAKFGAGIKPIDSFDQLTVGGGTKFSYAFFNEVGTANDESFFSYAFFPYARFRITEQFYLKGEYNFYSRDLGSNPNADDRFNFSFPMVGGGYVQGFEEWRFGFEVLLLLGDSVAYPTSTTPNGATKSDLYTLIEYNISFLYNL